ncbi:uncharacterized protein PV07_12602 [Cladophialophora immunda]|uniref:Plasmid pRiA4b Orf3-like domain-containing protein n=1 Tax=Cladophialophora immunda TaxID=569365 RepID=A0A0D2CEP6_9EURO|nr:uncharacterized protein PV07_12602 [Cladophialophora immunda]KIW21994.1 hypothetical protein PV07_12602 [Cladophialophora immunda]
MAQNDRDREIAQEQEEQHEQGIAAEDLATAIMTEDMADRQSPTASAPSPAANLSLPPFLAYSQAQSQLQIGTQIGPQIGPYSQGTQGLLSVKSGSQHRLLRTAKVEPMDADEDHRGNAGVPIGTFRHPWLPPITMVLRQFGIPWVIEEWMVRALIRSQLWLAERSISMVRCQPSLCRRTGALEPTVYCNYKSRTPLGALDHFSFVALSPRTRCLDPKLENHAAVILSSPFILECHHHRAIEHIPKATMPKDKTTARREHEVSPHGSAKSASFLSKEDATTAKTTAGSKAPTMRGESASPNYIFHCSMVCSSNPTITRLLSVPSSFTFEDMHGVMQDAFGWANCHTWSFELRRLYYGEEEEREGMKTNGFVPLMVFQTDPEMLKDTFPESASTYQAASKWTLSDVFEEEQYRFTNLLYEYDHGDGWEHVITLVGIEDPGFRKAMMLEAEYDSALCFAGEGHPCAEDCGGEPGWEDLKQIFAKKGSRAKDGRKNWYKTYCANGDAEGLDPYRWDMLDVNAKLQNLTKKRK